MPKDDVYYLIPTLVIHWILLYFHQREHFDPSHCSNYIILSEDNTIATQTGDRKEMFVLLSKIARSGVHRWKFKLLENNGYIKTIGIFKSKLYSPALDSDATSFYYVTKAYNMNLGSKKLIKYKHDEQSRLLTPQYMVRNVAKEPLLK